MLTRMFIFHLLKQRQDQFQYPFHIMHTSVWVSCVSILFPETPFGSISFRDHQVSRPTPLCNSPQYVFLTGLESSRRCSRNGVRDKTRL